MPATSPRPSHFAEAAATGYAWPAHPGRVRPARAAEREAFEHEAGAPRREAAKAVRRMTARLAR